MDFPWKKNTKQDTKFAREECACHEGARVCWQTRGSNQSRQEACLISTRKLFRLRVISSILNSFAQSLHIYWLPNKELETPS